MPPYKEIPYIEVSQISTKDLKFNPKDFIIKADDLREKQVKTGKFLNEEAYLVSLIGTKLKPSFVKPSESLVHLSNDIVAFEINEKLVNPKWLVRELNSTKVKDQLEVLVSGVIPRIRKKDFFNLKINLPSLKEQNKQLDEIQGLEKRVDSLESDIIEQNAYLRHTVAGPLSDLEHSIHSIEGILNQIRNNEVPTLLEKKASEKHLFTLGQYLESSKKLLNTVLEVVTDRLSSSQRIEHKKLYKINLFEHLKNYVSRKNESFQKLDYSIQFSSDPFYFDSKAKASENDEKDYEHIVGNEELINNLLDNMLDNAIKHAFPGEENKKIEIHAWGWNEDTSEDLIFFSIANTGKRLPKNTSFEDLKRRGFGKSDNKGDGFGLWLVNEIVKKHKGDWFLTDSSMDEDGESNLVSIYSPESLLEGVDNLKPIGYRQDEFVTKFIFSFPILTE